MGQVESLLKVTNDPVDFMCQVCKELYQVWSLTLFYSVDFSKSRIDVKKSAFSTNAQSRFASVVVDGVLGPPRLWATPDGVLISL